MNTERCSQGRVYNCRMIETFDDLISHIMWEWDKDNVLVRLNTGELQINKTTIGKDFLDYKCEYYPLKEGLYEELNKFYKILKANRQ